MGASRMCTTDTQGTVAETGSEERPACQTSITVAGAIAHIHVVSRTSTSEVQRTVEKVDYIIRNDTLHLPRPLQQRQY
jgi:hypothetical protein